MVKTRGAHRRSASARRSYRRRVKSSKCRGKPGYSCAATPGCRRASGKKRSFCRKSKNTKRHRGGRRRSHRRRSHRRHHKRSHHKRSHHKRSHHRRRR